MVPTNSIDHLLLMILLGNQIGVVLEKLLSNATQIFLIHLTLVFLLVSTPLFFSMSIFILILILMRLLHVQKLRLSTLAFSYSRARVLTDTPLYSIKTIGVLSKKMGAKPFKTSFRMAISSEHL